MLSFVCMNSLFGLTISTDNFIFLKKLFTRFSSKRGKEYYENIIRVWLINLRDSTYLIRRELIAFNWIFKQSDFRLVYIFT